MARLLTLEHIIGSKKKQIEPIIPVSKSTWYAGVATGRFPKGHKLGCGRTFWHEETINNLVNKAYKDDR